MFIQYCDPNRTRSTGWPDIVISHRVSSRLQSKSLVPNADSEPLEGRRHCCDDVPAASSSEAGSHTWPETVGAIKHNRLSALPTRTHFVPAGHRHIAQQQCAGAMRRSCAKKKHRYVYCICVLV